MTEFRETIEAMLPVFIEAATWRGDVPAWLSVLVSATIWMVGASVASFGGLFVDRLPGILGLDDEDERGICFPPSTCDSCGNRIGWMALIPVFGWIIKRGRCGHCGVAVPSWYPKFEAFLGTGTALIPVMVDDPVEAAVLVGMLWVGTILMWCDLRYRILPEVLTMPLMFAGLILSPFEPDPWLRSVGAATAAALVWGTMSVMSRLRGIDAYSGGDVAIAAAAGAWVGFHGVPSLLLMTCGIFLIYALIMRKRGVEWIPMGPAFVIAMQIEMIALINP
jgi:Type II secretory pathway, prepilin signal peptidase PulO and related peptidases